MSSERRSDERLKRIGLITSIIWVVGAGVYVVVMWSAIFELKPNEFGDFLAGVFAPLAFFWLVLGFYQQGEELRASVDALTLQSEEMRHSVEQQRVLADATREQLEREKAAAAAMEFAAKSANIEVHLIKQPGGRAYHLSVLNKGPARAKSVDIDLDEGAIFVIDEELNSAFPTNINEGKSKSVTAHASLGRGRLVTGRVSWIDGNGAQILEFNEPVL